MASFVHVRSIYAMPAQTFMAEQYLPSLVVLL